MITGFNTNVRYRDRTFHVQTEDSGARNPHVISHLYHGGTILASEKRDYSQELGSDDLEGRVRELMETQHKSMLRCLKNGDFDGVIAERLEGGPPATQPEIPADAATSPELQEASGSEPRIRAAASEGHVFGDDVVSEKPLDEVILEYLVQKARDRAVRPAASGSRSGPRPAKG